MRLAAILSCVDSHLREREREKETKERRRLVIIIKVCELKAACSFLCSFSCSAISYLISFSAITPTRSSVRNLRGRECSATSMFINLCQRECRQLRLRICRDKRLKNLKFSLSLRSSLSLLALGSEAGIRDIFRNGSAPLNSSRSLARDAVNAKQKY